MLHDKLHQFLATEIVGQAPSLRFVDPHQRRFDQEALVHAQ